MKILVVSDEHGDYNALQCVLQMESYSHVFCLGDGVRDYEDAKDDYMTIPFHIVTGNCDWYTSSHYPAVNLEVIEGKRILYMHGHIQDVKHTLSRAIALGKQDQADVLLYGHTHYPHEELVDGMLVCNPGSLANGAYGILTIENGQVSWQAKSL